MFSCVRQNGGGRAHALVEETYTRRAKAIKCKDKIKMDDDGLETERREKAWYSRI